MILEEIKFRLQAAGLNEKDRFGLVRAADGVMVQARGDRFLITLYDRPVMEMDPSKVHLYTRGDTEATVLRQSDTAKAAGRESDSLLESNRRAMVEVVDRLLEWQASGTGS